MWMIVIGAIVVVAVVAMLVAAWYAVGYGNGYEAAMRESQEEHYLTD